MDLVQQLNDDLKDAMKKGEKEKLSIVRMLKAGMMNEKVKLGHDLSDSEAVEVVNREIKQHKDSIEQFTAGKRDDLVKEQTKELDILKKYAPKQLSPAEVKKVVEETAKQLGTKSKSDFGKLMGAVMGKLKGKADGNDVKKAVNDTLS
ncbi:hypothetical protein BGL34_01615 [Fructilactobacillus lindneri]|uniref:GatB/YqeY domain-containing protein n=2 Tax=Fructilactobacillus lindneri TaxID=53444 RepID=A0A0R2JPC2_9LACO|nr:GatB/YqeY domain-containing protein [Fructilactobacillus lindneri]ANZ58134.1 hypothetical protein AYR60_04970 [Fructilactobacillus lindneri]ANZ59455.1 hypothetical protein AYR59_05225 [Fructilactobacillus lindneri]KRN78952.1 hypothetical protein IV52_GL000356 [Fructilactobacillus lindneri DSM 20690 = JCM 11027]POG98761.1 hypothetical protein BGL31_02205 [Fructilactobacillus lindneri]POH03034.1 hypothetical protein BGL33_03640 [Fructilactobacillus lindneri]